MSNTQFPLYKFMLQQIHMCYSLVIFQYVYSLSFSFKDFEEFTDFTVHFSKNNISI